MFKSIFKWPLSFLCVITCVFSMLTPCIAASMPMDNGGIELMMLNISDAQCDLTVNNGIAEASGSVTGNFGAEQCRVILTIQEQRGASWVTIGYWSVTEDGRNASISNSVEAESGKAYRASATVIVWIDGESERQTITTASKTAK